MALVWSDGIQEGFGLILGDGILGDASVRSHVGPPQIVDDQLSGGQCSESWILHAADDVSFLVLPRDFGQRASDGFAREDYPRTHVLEQSFVVKSNAGLLQMHKHIVVAGEVGTWSIDVENGSGRNCNLSSRTANAGVSTLGSTR